MYQENIKGQCESCGFLFEGLVTLEHGAFPNLNCPACSEETFNFDSASAVDALNEAEGAVLVYQQVNFSKNDKQNSSRVRSSRVAV